MDFEIKKPFYSSLQYSFSQCKIEGTYFWDWDRPAVVFLPVFLIIWIFRIKFFKIYLIESIKNCQKSNRWPKRIKKPQRDKVSSLENFYPLQLLRFSQEPILVNIPERRYFVFVFYDLVIFIDSILALFTIPKFSRVCLPFGKEVTFFCSHSEICTMHRKRERF